jgi:probable HAF family extracellular repeat protein
MNKKTNPNRKLSCLLMVLFSQTINPAFADGMSTLGALGGTDSFAVGISADGSVIAGYFITGSYDYHAFKYTGTTMTDLGALGGNSIAWAISADGSVIVGQSQIAVNSAYHAFKYQNGTMVDLGTLGGTISKAYGVSADGSVIAGDSRITGSFDYHAFKYQNGTMIDLGTLGGTNSHANGVSSDGSVIVGYSYITNNTADHAFKYTGGTLTDLGTLGGTDSYAYGVSADGSVIVGESRITGSTNYHAFKYQNGTMVDLGTLGGTISRAYGVSSDGSVIVGESRIAGSSSYHAFKYQNGTMVDLGTLGGAISRANGVSSDGSVIVGESQITGNSVSHAFIYRNTIVDVDNTITALSGNMRQQSAVLNLQNSLLNIGLNHDCTNFGQNNLCVAVGGAYTSLNSPHAAQSSANLRVAYQVTPNIRVGAFADQSIHSSTPNNYDLKNDMPLIGAFAAWSQSPNDLGIGIKASLAYHQRDVNITRSVLAYTEAGRGDSQFTTKGAQVEGTYGFALNNTWLAQPFAGVRVSSVSRDAYRETTGAEFPIAYDHASQNATTTYVGARFAGKITEKAVLRVAGGVEQDIHHRVSEMTGVINTLGAFSVSAPNILHTRAFVRGSVDYAVTPNSLLNVSVMANQNALNHSVDMIGMATYQVGF